MLFHYAQADRPTLYRVVCKLLSTSVYTSVFVQMHQSAKSFSSKKKKNTGENLGQTDSFHFFFFFSIAFVDSGKCVCL